MRRLRHTLIAWLVALLLCGGCSASVDPLPEVSSQDVEAGDLSGVEVDDGSPEAEAGSCSGYPAGPYGTSVGSTIKDHSFRDPKTDAMVLLSDLFLAPEESLKKLLFLNASAGWCPACKEEAVELKKVYAEYADKGLEVWFTLFEDQNGSPVSDAFWNSWVSTYNPTYPTYLDVDFGLGVYFNSASAPMNMLVRLDTMEIVYLQTGFDEDAVHDKLEEFLD